ncbi:MAG TPA: oligosaccharide flippase family protein [Lacipirellulaceae bacterium]|nr:oligosaccharide flippase family protein [Lacipirellulaceae bacterium]
MSPDSQPQNDDQSDARTKSAAGTLSQRIVVGTAWIMAGRVLSILALLAGNVLLSHRLSDAEFGAYLMASFLMPFFAVLANWGSQEILMREVRASLVAGDSARAWWAIRSCVTICAGASLLVGCGLAGVMGSWRAEQAHWIVLQDHVVLIALWIFFQTMGQVASEACRGCGQFGWSVALYTKSGGAATNVLAVLFFLAAWPTMQPADFTVVLILQVLASALPAIAGFIALSRNLGAAFEHHNASPPITDDSAARAPDPTIAWFVKESWPLLVSYTVIIGIEQLDILVVGLVVVDDSSLADYGVAKRLLSVINFAFVSLAPAITPFVAELHQRRDHDRMQKLLQGAATVVAVPTVLLCAGLFLLAGPVIAASFGESRLGAVPALRVMLAGQVLLSLAGHSYLALAMTGRQTSLMHCSLVVGVIYLVVGPALTMLWGIVGAGAAKSLATAARAALAAILVRRELGIWTTASLSPAVVRATCQIAANRTRKALRLGSRGTRQI